MKPTKIWANLGVKDVEKTGNFYTSLGFKSNEGCNKTKELTSFLIGNNNFVVHFFSPSLVCHQQVPIATINAISLIWPTHKNDITLKFK